MSTTSDTKADNEYNVPTTIVIGIIIIIANIELSFRFLKKIKASIILSQRKWIIIVLAFGDCLSAIFLIVTGTSRSLIDCKSQKIMLIYINFYFPFVYALGLLTLCTELTFRRQLRDIVSVSLFASFLTAGVPWILGLIIVLPLTLIGFSSSLCRYEPALSTHYVRAVYNLTTVVPFIAVVIVSFMVYTLELNVASEYFNDDVLYQNFFEQKKARLITNVSAKLGGKPKSNATTSSETKGTCCQGMVCLFSSKKHEGHSTLENAATQQEPVQDNTQKTLFKSTQPESEAETVSSKNDKPIKHEMLSLSPHEVTYSYGGRTYSKMSIATFNSSTSKARPSSSVSARASSWSSTQYTNTTVTSLSTAMTRDEQRALVVNCVVSCALSVPHAVYVMHEGLVQDIDRLVPLPSDSISLILLCSLYLRGVMAPSVWIIYDKSVQIDVPKINIHQAVLQRPQQGSTETIQTIAESHKVSQASREAPGRDAPVDTGHVVMQHIHNAGNRFKDILTSAQILTSYESP